MQKWMMGLAVVLLVPGAWAQGAKATGAKAETAEFQAAGKAFEAGEYAAALAGFKQLIKEEPENGIYKKFASEAALNIGDAGFVLETLPPVEQADPEDWQARLLLARAYAQTAEAPGHTEKRDEEIAAVRKLHAADPNSALGKLRDFKLETVHAGGKTVQFFPAFVPWGPYNVHLLARTYDETKQPGLLLTLESGDADQPLFAEQHPKEAAEGLRSFSLDGYRPGPKTADGQATQTHFTYGFFIGEPAYDAVRAQMLAILAGTQKPLSSRTGPVE